MIIFPASGTNRKQTRRSFKAWVEFLSLDLLASNDFLVVLTGVGSDTSEYFEFSGKKILHWIKRIRWVIVTSSQTAFVQYLSGKQQHNSQFSLSSFFLISKLASEVRFDVCLPVGTSPTFRSFWVSPWRRFCPCAMIRKRMWEWSRMNASIKQSR